MNEENKELQPKVLKSRLLASDIPPLGDLSNIIAAQKEIAKLPYGSMNPKAIEIARKHGLDFVPHG